ncbi:hypothetical protein E2C01_057392 [Portunus trituberculatus]|uniref:Uncharacterized protein n=1 Tax=Portunus trituberculatus TaxID=210409 RepID=A0A5B7H0D1_PORTR|nr:hypothetical protein [Portunus trituberculatus]
MRWAGAEARQVRVRTVQVYKVYRLVAMQVTVPSVLLRRCGAEALMRCQCRAWGAALLGTTLAGGGWCLHNALHEHLPTCVAALVSDGPWGNGSRQAALAATPRDNKVTDWPDPRVTDRKLPNTADTSTVCN